MNATNDSTPHEMRLLLRVSVLLPIASVFMLALTHIWQEAQTPDAHIAFLVVIAITPALIVYLPGIERRLGKRFLPIVLGVYLVCQTTLTAVLQNMSMARFDLMQVGPIPVVEPGVLLMIPLLLIAWQFGWKGALLASASAGTLHMLIGLAIHGLMPGNKQLSLAAPILRPDLLYFLPLVVAYLGGLLRRQQRHEAETHLRWREYAATAEVLAIDRERKRLAGELRQTVLDSLSGLAQQLGLLSKADPEPDALQTAQQLIREDMDTVGQLVSDLEADAAGGNKPGAGASGTRQRAIAANRCCGRCSGGGVACKPHAGSGVVALPCRRSGAQPYGSPRRRQPGSTAPGDHEPHRRPDRPR